MKKQIWSATCALVLGLLMVTFNNCSNVKFEAGDTTKAVAATGIPGVTEPPPTVTEAVANCQQATAQKKLVSKSLTIGFADSKVESKRSKVCLFAATGKETADGNLDQVNDYLRARYEQSQALALPANAVLCNVTMQTDKQSFKYDDVFYLTFNNKVLASNLQASLKTLKYSNISVTGDARNIPLYDYAWVNGVRNQNFKGVNETADDYCLGSAEGHSSCAWPLSQQTGNIKFSFDPEILINIGLASPSTEQRFGFTITGDDDPDSDCYHEALNFNATVSYYLRN